MRLAGARPQLAGLVSNSAAGASFVRPVSPDPVPVPT